MNGAFDEALRSGRHLTVIFHPYVFGTDESLWEVFITFVRRLTAHDGVWLASCRDVAERRSRTAAASASV